MNKGTSHDQVQHHPCHPDHHHHHLELDLIGEGRLLLPLGEPGLQGGEEGGEEARQAPGRPHLGGMVEGGGVGRKQVQEGGLKVGGRAEGQKGRSGALCWATKKI